MELGIHGLHPDLIKLIGRLKYRTSFGQNALTHSMEVAWVAGLLAGEMGVNVTMARRAGLLHDIGKALDHEIEGSHVQIGVDICRKYKENTQIILRALRWMGLDWDEGPEVGGPCGPYFQPQRTDTYAAALQKLLAAGAAYP